jgi:hypothetical protein
MAKINEEVLVIKITTLLSDQSEMTAVMSASNVAALKQVIEELAGDSKTLVEIEKAQ